MYNFRSYWLFRLLQIYSLYFSYNLVYSLFDWSCQQKLLVHTRGNTYGVTPPLLVGRGFVTIISGYDDDIKSPGVYVHTTDQGYIAHGQMVWSQQAKLIPTDLKASEDSNFGKWMVSWNHTLIISAPTAGSGRGFVYIFNGTIRHWSQIQRLVAYDGAPNDGFGEKMALHKDRLAIAAKAAQYKTPLTSALNAGAVYVYERQAPTLYWSRMAKLLPRDYGVNNFFGQELSIYENMVVVTAQNDGDFLGKYDVRTGSAYIYTGSAGVWSQQQKLIAYDFQIYKKSLDPDPLVSKSSDQLQALLYIDLTLGERILGPSIAIDKHSIAVGITNLDPNYQRKNRESVYLYHTVKYADNTVSWSLQQKLFAISDKSNDATLQQYNHTNIYMDAFNNLVTTIVGPKSTSSYVFKTFGDGWSLQQLLTPFYNDTLETAPTWSNPAIWGGYILFRNDSDPAEVIIQSRFRNNSCLRIWMSDHFLDGWDTAVLTVRAPDLTNDTFHPHCDQVDPFYVRYCPYQPEDEGVYIVKVFAATSARFFWEIAWQVQVEDTGVWYKGDFATKMQFNFNATTNAFSLFSIENEIDLEAPCYKCTRIASRSWAELQVVGNSAFWPLVVTGAPYYISEYQGRLVYSSGKVCGDANSFECYQTLTNGVYILRLGGGLFGDLTGFPRANASWIGCGATGDQLDQLTFLINDGKCRVLQIDRYTGRCYLPPPIDYYGYEALIAGTVSTASATASHQATMAPTQNVFGIRGPNSGANSFDRKINPNTAHDVAEPNKLVEKENDVKNSFELLNTLLEQRPTSSLTTKIQISPSSQKQHTQTANLNSIEEYEFYNHEFEFDVNDPSENWKFELLEYQEYVQKKKENI